MKLWRTNRVDVDSKAKPCLERMMKIMEEGVVHIATKNALCCEDEIVAFDELEKVIATVLIGDGQKIYGSIFSGSK